MPPPASEIESLDDPVVKAIGKAGITGITAKQLSTVTALEESAVVERLRHLATDKAIHRIGRGLWVLQRFASVDSTTDDLRGASWYDYAFSTEFHLEIGKRQGEIQFNPNERRPVHRWWPYVQGFSAGFVEETCRMYDVARGSTVLDPFCGSGTVPVVARMLGAKGLGVDMLPIAAFVAKAKLIWDVSPSSLRRAADRVVLDRSPPSLQPPFLKETRRQFRPGVLRSLLRLKESIWGAKPGPVKELLRLAFSSILIDSSNLKRAPCLGYATKLGLTDETPFELFRAVTVKMEADLDYLARRKTSWGPLGEIRLASSGTSSIPEGSVDLAVTSPPYVNGMDYVMNYKIDLAWMDFVKSYDELANLRASMVACDNIPRGTSLGHSPSALVQTDGWVVAVGQEIKNNIGARGTYRRDDMPEIVRKYFDDLTPVMSNVLQALKPGGRFVVVNGDSLMAGTYIPGDLIFARLAAKLGFEVERFEIARIRRSGQRRGFLLRESVLTLRKPGVNHQSAVSPGAVTLESFEPR